MKINFYYFRRFPVKLLEIFFQQTRHFLKIYDENCQQVIHAFQGSLEKVFVQFEEDYNRKDTVYYIVKNTHNLFSDGVLLLRKLIHETVSFLLQLLPEEQKKAATELPYDFIEDNRNSLHMQEEDTNSIPVQYIELDDDSPPGADTVRVF